MKAAILYEAREPLRIEEVALDLPRPREVLVRVAASGLCHSDYNYVSGARAVQMPAVLGHEVAGIVEAVGSDVSIVNVGDHVVTCAALFCGDCDTCLSGRTHICSNRPVRTDGTPRLTLNGQPVNQFMQMSGFAEQMLVHEHAVVRISRDVPLDRAALLGCGVMTGLGAVFNAARVTAGSRVAIIGCGGVGLNIVQGAVIAGARQIVAVDLVPEKRALARAMGATHVLEGGEHLVEQVRDLTGGGCDFSFEVVGLPQTMAQAIRLLAPGGLMTIVGAMRDDAVIPVPGIDMLRNEWRMQGSFLGSTPFMRDIPRFANLYLDGRLDLDSLIGQRIPLDAINEGFRSMEHGSVARSVIVFPEVIGKGGNQCRQ